MTRIISGEYGGRRLAVPAGRDTRPTSDRVREALFSALTSAIDLDGARVADLYAGSGAVGLEAASRGAAHVLLVESERRAAQVIRRNLATLGVADRAELRPVPVEQVVAQPAAQPYDVVFVDPPYAVPDSAVADVLTGLVEHGWLAPEALVVVERGTRSGEFGWVTGILPVRSRQYGETALWYGRAS